ncbi:D-ribose pyranase [Litorisediminicola beolgyonensis]|uniref:D-ribose pyranase n=1 Tax=Litorisediminicola beolgyonensis TaxID=1173614 RepID=A0ABW3ZKT1_9RHOB
MKKNGILNAELSRIVAALGHGDRVVIADAGLPVPPGVTCVDLAVRLGVPGFWDVLDAVLSEMVVEQAVIAEEASEEVRAQFAERLEVEADSHVALKEMSQGAICIVRTGEAVPYTNVVLVSGVPF